MNFDDHDKFDSPLLKHPLDAESVSTPQALIEDVRAKKGFRLVLAEETIDLRYGSKI
jgi:hypothetical protein